jgi:dinuclear metal center YbgI/SA1388 family protein
MHASLPEIIAQLDQLLESQRFQDYCHNGLQVPGPQDVRAVATGVSAHAQLFDLAAAERVQLLVVHHGLFWGSGIQAIDPALKRRLQILFDAEIALAAYHLPLDAHPLLGNNVLLARELHAQPVARFGLHHGQAIGVLAELAGDGLSAQDLAARVSELTAREPLLFDFGPERVRRLAIVSGAGADFLAEAAAAGAEAFLTGEPAERVMAQAREAQLHFIAAGHHATETLGIRALGAYLTERFGLKHVFLDVPNPV